MTAKTLPPTHGLTLCLQQASTSQRPLHLHVLELGDGEVEVLDGGEFRDIRLLDMHYDVMLVAV